MQTTPTELSRPIIMSPALAAKLREVVYKVSQKAVAANHQGLRDETTRIISEVGEWLGWIDDPAVVSKKIKEHYGQQRFYALQPLLVFFVLDELRSPEANFDPKLSAELRALLSFYVKAETEGAKAERRLLLAPVEVAEAKPAKSSKSKARTK